MSKYTESRKAAKEQAKQADKQQEKQEETQKTKSKKQKPIFGRCFNISTRTHNNEGQELINEDIIRKAIEEHTAVKQWAYILHDKDVYTEEEELSNAEHVAGTPKPPHYHIVLSVPKKAELRLVAKWFNLPMNFVEVAKGRNAFIDCCRYMTHEDEKQQDMGKHLYEDEEITANFEFRKEFDKRAAIAERVAGGDNELEGVRMAVAFEGMGLDEVRENYPHIWVKDETKLKKLRKDYISNCMPMPQLRLNFFIEGKGGIGKSQLSKLLARCLVEDGDVLPPKKVYFEVGDNGSWFDDYDGQPVIIWQDQRAVDLVTRFGRDGIFNMFDITPTERAQNIKYSSVILKNKINIVNGIETFKDFVDGLAGEFTDREGNRREAEDINQGYRRIPFFLKLDENDFTFGVSMAFLEDTSEWRAYQKYVNITGSFKRVIKAAGNDDARRLQAAHKMFDKPVVETYNAVVENYTGENSGDETEMALLSSGEPSIMIQDFSTGKVSPLPLEFDENIIELESVDDIVKPDDDDDLPF